MFEWLSDNFLSLLALVIASISLYVSWRVYHLDKSDLKITDFHFELIDQMYPFFYISLVNKGRRLVRVTNVCLILKSRDRACSGHFKETILTEAEPTRVRYSLIEEWRYPKGTRVENPLDVTGVEVTDSLGNSYRFKLPPTEIEKIEQVWTVNLAAFLERNGENFVRGIG